MKTFHDENATVFIVDDDPYSRESIAVLVRTMNLKTATFDCAEEFLEEYSGQPGCLISDLRMPGLSGIELLQALRGAGWEIPTIVVTGFAEVSVAVEAMQYGAITLLEKPYQENQLWSVVRDALKQDMDARASQRERQEICERLACLSEEEEAILQLILQGLPNKQISMKLDIGLRTVESRRRRIFDKMNVDSVAVLVRDVLAATGQNNTTGPHLNFAAIAREAQLPNDSIGVARRD